MLYAVAFSTAVHETRREEEEGTSTVTSLGVGGAGGGEGYVVTLALCDIQTRYIQVHAHVRYTCTSVCEY